MSKEKTASPSPVTPVNLGWALATLMRTYQKQVEAVLTGLPGGSRAFLVMSLVERETCNSQIAIAERLGLDKTSLTYLLDSLEKETLIRRSTDPEDRRTRHITLTEDGAKMLAELARQVQGVENDVLSRLPDAEARQFYASLLKAAGLDSGPINQDGEEAAHICREALPGQQ